MQTLTLNSLTQIFNILEKHPEAAYRILEYYQSKESNAPKKFYLRKIPNKKLGVVYYVRYLDNGKLVPSNWSTGTNDYEMARKFAEENRERLLASYYGRDVVKKPYTELYIVLKNYYAKDSSYLQVDRKRGRIINETARELYNNFINRQFIPYLRKQGIKTFEEIDTPFLSRFQNFLLADKKIKHRLYPGVKPQTVNNYISYISTIFDHLIQEGRAKLNPCKSLISLRVKQDDQKITGCYEVSRLKGVFNKKWEDQFSYLLNLIIYTTNMRNSEIERIQVKDLIVIDKVNFIDIPASKSMNGERIVPLHPFVYKKIMSYVKKNRLKPDDYIFKVGDSKELDNRLYKKACLDLAKFTGYSEEKLKEENIRFYSGRHFWKTLMNAEGLGEDIEEIFMGHKVKVDVAKRYNHKDKQGKRKKLEKAKKVFSILDKRVFV